MKIIILILICISFLTIDAKSQFLNKVIIPFTITDDSTNYQIQIGISKNATDSIDDVLNELDIPDGELPGGLLNPTLALNYKNYDFHSKIDIKAFPSNKNKLHIIYYLQLGGTPHDSLYKISWVQGFNYLIDSAFLTDRLNQTLVNVNLNDTNSVYIKKYINLLFINVYYNLNSDNIFSEKENTKNSDSFIYPNPAINEINFKNYDFNYFEIINLVGEKILEGNLEFEKGNIDINFLSSGIYNINLFKINGSSISKQFVIFK